MISEEVKSKIKQALGKIEEDYGDLTIKIEIINITKKNCNSKNRSKR